MRTVFVLFLSLLFIAPPAQARYQRYDGIEVLPEVEPEMYGPIYPEDIAEEDVKVEDPAASEMAGPPAPGVKEEIYKVETDPCDSKEVKEFLVGNYIIVGQKKSSGALPAKADLYTAAADVRLEGCDLKITLCTAEGQETGTMKGILALADKIPMWKIESQLKKDDLKNGELKEYFLQMTSDLDNYPVLYGWGHQGYEFWRPDHNETAVCP